jgi:hypothetical protein
MIRCGTLLLLALVLAPCLVAGEYESRFGRTVLAKSDLIVDGIASANRNRIGGSFRVQITLQQTLHGEFRHRELSMHYVDRKALPEDEAVRGLFALKELASGGYELVGEPILMKGGDADEEEKRGVMRALLAIEAMAPGEQRSDSFWRLLMRYVREGGYSGEVAAIELIYVASERASIVTEARFEGLIEVRRDAGARLTRQARDDIELALQGMVEVRIKTLKLRRVRRGEDLDEKRQAAQELQRLVEDYPRAFSNSDAALLEAIAEVEDDNRLTRILDDTARAIRLRVREREARERAGRNGR